MNAPVTFKRSHKVTMYGAEQYALRAANFLLSSPTSKRVVLRAMSPGGIASALLIARRLRELSRGSLEVDVVDVPRDCDRGLEVFVSEVSRTPDRGRHVALVYDEDPDVRYVFPWTSTGDRAVDPDEALVKGMLEAIGEDAQREGLLETPARVVKAWKTWFAGYQQDPASVLKVFKDGAEGVDEMVLETDIPVYSFCEHHMAPIFGIAHVAYIPNGKVVGLSKLVRVVDIFARRLQVQERLTNQVADALNDNLDAKGVGVVMQCRHMCMEGRGICRHGVVTTTSALRGAIKDEHDCRAEFLSLISMTKSPSNAIL